METMYKKGDIVVTYIKKARFKNKSISSDSIIILVDDAYFDEDLLVAYGRYLNVPDSYKELFILDSEFITVYKVPHMNTAMYKLLHNIK